MPDFFLDIIVGLSPRSLEGFCAEVAGVVSRGGGNIIVTNRLVRGGNAANTASALAALGVEVRLAATVDELGYAVLAKSLKGVDVVPIWGEQPITVALELPGANVMLSNPGRLSCVGPSDVEALVEDRYDAVAVLNWAQNRCGTELAFHVFSRVGGAIRYLDPSDPTIAMDRLPSLVDLLRSGLVDVLSINENEALRIAEHLGFQGDRPDKAAEHIYRQVNVRVVDLHTSTFSFSMPSGAYAPTHAIEPKLLTGAGDSWNAGNLYGHMAGMPPERRLALANAVAGYYITRGVHGALADVENFMSSTPLRPLGL